MQKRDTYWNVVHKVGLGAALMIGIVGIIFVVVAFGNKVKQMHEYQAKYDSLQHRIEVTSAQTKKIKSDHRQFLTDPAFVERIAHQVGYAKKDEVIYEFSQESTK